MQKYYNLFGEKDLPTQKEIAVKKQKFQDYEGFVEKFKPKKTTDDCYTPEDVYQLVLDYVGEKIDLNDKIILRPFYPGGDYESIDYPTNSIVIDNPPFSIISKICKYYISNNIKFFLFAPHITLFNVARNTDIAYIVTDADIVYENGAKVKTSFVTNLFNPGIIGDHELFERFKALNETKEVSLPKYKYPNNVLTVPMITSIIKNGISIKIDKGNYLHASALDSQKKQKKSIFGGGFFISEKAVAEKAVAEKAVAEKETVIIWELSEREKNIIKSLGQHNETTHKPTNNDKKE